MVNEMYDLIWRGGVVAWLTNMGHPKLASMVADEKRFPSEIKHGRWVDVELEETFCWHGHCSVCGNFNVVSDYCCDCGAKMDNVNEVVE